MNPIRIIKDAWATLSRGVSAKADRLVSEDRERLQRRERYEGEIARGRARLNQQSSDA